MKQTTTTEVNMNAVAINRSTYNHGIIASNRARRAAGQHSTVAVAERAARAHAVLVGYDIYALGSKTNGWNERVEAYKLVKPNGKGYEVQIRANGEVSCNCLDWCTRRKAHGGLCKHGIAIRALRSGGNV